MSGLRLEYRIKDHQARALFADLEQLDMRPALDEVGGYLGSETARRFNAGEDWQGKALIQSERAKNENGKTLIDRGHLRDSYTYRVSGNEYVEYGSADIRAAILHFGGKTGRNYATVLPARPVAGINSGDESEIESIIDDHVARVLQ